MGEEQTTKEKPKLREDKKRTFTATKELEFSSWGHTPGLFLAAIGGNPETVIITEDGELIKSYHEGDKNFLEQAAAHFKGKLFMPGSFSLEDFLWALEKLNANQETEERKGRFPVENLTAWRECIPFLRSPLTVYSDMYVADATGDALWDVKIGLVPTREGFGYRNVKLQGFYIFAEREDTPNRDIPDDIIKSALRDFIEEEINARRLPEGIVFSVDRDYDRRRNESMRRMRISWQNYDRFENNPIEGYPTSLKAIYARKIPRAIQYLRNLVSTYFSNKQRRDIAIAQKDISDLAPAVNAELTESERNKAEDRAREAEKKAREAEQDSPPAENP
ncbi:hypothetical protein KY335_04215 [Candidatus Woesearchaeota archaeon]|nr:hypothetical protein [Candidatus Woesearchaeota archaeon]